MNYFFQLPDRFLNHITMYRLVLYYCAALLVGDFALAVLGKAQHEALPLLVSAALICAVSWVVNWAMAWVLRIPANVESVWITALITTLIMSPVAFGDWYGFAGLALAAAVGVASKFILAINRKHIFNPVALGVLVSAYALDAPATWWVGGTVWLLPITVIGGILILRKLQRFEMFWAYLGASLCIAIGAADFGTYITTLRETFLASPLLFLGFAMLTEPMTAPAARLPSVIFGALVGVTASTAFNIGGFYPTPEMALMLGNVFAWAINPKYRFKLVLDRVEKSAAGCYDYVFHSNRPINHEAGQYLDWTMHVPSSDTRGNRRTFTIASSPAEPALRLGVKFYGQPSAYKKAMLEMRPGDVVYGAQLAGDFVLPKTDDKVAFIAGGIGITPFRSMIQHMMDVGDKRDATLFYGNNRSSEIAYVDVFNRAEAELGLRTVYAVADQGQAKTKFHSGFIDADLITREMPDYADRLFYVSGPRMMVLKFEKVLAELGIARHRIKTDYFPGFA